MEMNSTKTTLETLVYPDKNNKDVHEEANNNMVKEKNLKILFNTTNNVFHTLLTQQAVHQSNSLHSQVILSALIPTNKKENVQQTPIKCNASNYTSLLRACREQNYNDVNCKSERCSDEGKPCSSQYVRGNEFRLTVDRKQNNSSNCKGSCIYSTNSGKNKSPPNLISPPETENDRRQESVEDSSSLGYYGHWLEIKQENIEEMKDKFLPECELDEAGENGISSTEEMSCKNPDLEEVWSPCVPRKVYENKRLIKCKDKYMEGCDPYLHGRCPDSCEEQQVAGERNTPFASTWGHNKSTSTSRGNSTVSSLVTDTGWLGNKEIHNGSVGVSTGLFGSWLKIEDENNQSIKFVVIPDESRAVEDKVNSVNEAVLVENTGTDSETRFSSTGNEDHSAMSLLKTEEQHNSLSYEIVMDHENSNQEITTPLVTCKNLSSSANDSREINSLSDLDFFSTNADVEKDEYCFHIQDDVDSFLGITRGKKEHLIQSNWTNEKEMSSSDEYSRETWQCATCHLQFDSRIALETHTVVFNHVGLYICTRCKQVFKRAYKLTHHLQKNYCFRFKCSICNKKFPNKALLRNHVPFHCVDCHVCGRTCRNDTALKLHIDRHHSVKLYLCAECNKCFGSSKQRWTHLRLCHSVKYPKFTCSICKNSYADKSTLIYHLNKHLGEKKFFCPDCGERFITQKQLQGHRVKHVTEKLRKCSVCSKGFKTSLHLTRHMHTHTLEKRHECADCGRCFLRASNLRCHMLLHAGVKKFHCDICKGSFFSKPSLMMHMAKHLSGQPMSKHVIKCTICCLDTRNLKTSLKTHLKQHTIRPKLICKGKSDCHVCGRRYKSKLTLGYHLNTSHRHVNSFKCVKCKAVFPNFVNLLCHSYLHLRTKKYRCNICGDEFSLLKDLILHWKGHTEQISYKCSICKQRFPEYFVLVRHLKQHVEEKHLRRELLRQD